MDARAPNLFVGLGNVLCGDDGVGVRAAEIMAGLPLPPEVEVYEAGTALTELAGVLERRERVVVVDAIDAEAEPGTVFRLEPDQLQRRELPPLSAHQLDILHALDETELLGRAPESVVILAVQAGDVSRGFELSPSVEGSLFKVLGAAVHELGLPLDILDYVRLSADGSDVPATATESDRRGTSWN
jgi:hydrogenase maturation protease